MELYGGNIEHLLSPRDVIDPHWFLAFRKLLKPVKVRFSEWAGAATDTVETIFQKTTGVLWSIWPVPVK